MVYGVFLLMKYVLVIKVQSCCFFISPSFKTSIAISGYLAGWCAALSLPTDVIV